MTAPMSAFGPSGHRLLHRTCLLSGVKRLCRYALHMSAFDPKRTSLVQFCRGAQCVSSWSGVALDWRGADETVPVHNIVGWCGCRMAACGARTTGGPSAHHWRDDLPV